MTIELQENKTRSSGEENKNMRTGAVIAAAGMSSRMGDFKPMLKIGRMSIIQRIITNFQQADVFPIVVVTGYRAKELEKHISKMGVICTRNNDYENTEMFDSAKLGFSFIMDKCDRAFFTPVDIPLFTMDTVNRLLQTDRDIVKPVCNGVDGHPILIKTKILSDICQMDGEANLKSALQVYGSEMELLTVEDEGILHDSDTPEQYQELIDQHNRQLFRPEIDISLMREGKLFDMQSAMLLHTIEYSGTVKDACEKIGISYSKAWGIIAGLEDNLGFSLIDRKPGGEAGGGSRLTEHGKNLLMRYERYVEDVRKYANRVLSQYFEEGQREE